MSRQGKKKRARGKTCVLFKQLQGNTLTNARLLFRILRKLLVPSPPKGIVSGHAPIVLDDAEHDLRSHEVHSKSNRQADLEANPASVGPCNLRDTYAHVTQ